MVRDELLELESGAHIFDMAAVLSFCLSTSRHIKAIICELCGLSEADPAITSKRLPLIYTALPG